ncbi:hypothetical protein LZ554_001184 [Drepanopeziza brunnea f. sp. 'monogermtubi']|nr:hypothetical protein LZ554_001184 [Drepanopeziza brunnea f. sp. 'monogermtubi']
MTSSALLAEPKDKTLSNAPHRLAEDLSRDRPVTAPAHGERSKTIVILAPAGHVKKKQIKHNRMVNEERMRSTEALYRAETGLLGNNTRAEVGTQDRDSEMARRQELTQTSRSRFDKSMTFTAIQGGFEIFDSRNIQACTRNAKDNRRHCSTASCGICEDETDWIKDDVAAKSQVPSSKVKKKMAVNDDFDAEDHFEWRGALGEGSQRWPRSYADGARRRGPSLEGKKQETEVYEIRDVNRDPFYSDVSRKMRGGEMIIARRHQPISAVPLAPMR